MVRELLGLDVGRQLLPKQWLGICSGGEGETHTQPVSDRRLLSLQTTKVTTTLNPTAAT